MRQGGLSQCAGVCHADEPHRLLVVLLHIVKITVELGVKNDCRSGGGKL